MIASDDGGTEMTFNADGTYRFWFEAYSIEDLGTYTYENGVLTLTDKNGKTSVGEGDPIKLHYAYSDSDQLTGDYTIPAEALSFGTAAAPAVETPVEAAPAEEIVATEAPVEEVPATEAPAEEVPATEAPVEEAPVTEAPVEEVAATEAPAAEVPAAEPVVKWCADPDRQERQDVRGRRRSDQTALHLFGQRSADRGLHHSCRGSELRNGCEGNSGSTCC